MSTDLQVRQDFLEVQLPKIKTNSSSELSDDDRLTKLNAQDQEEEEECKTPTSPRHRIPAAVECPPAPRKPWPVMSSSSCKRKRQYLELTEEELEAIFEGLKRRSCDDDEWDVNEETLKKDHGEN